MIFLFTSTNIPTAGLLSSACVHRVLQLRTAVHLVSEWKRCSEHAECVGGATHTLFCKHKHWPSCEGLLWFTENGAPATGLRKSEEVADMAPKHLKGLHGTLTRGTRPPEPTAVNISAPPHQILHHNKGCCITSSAPPDQYL